MNDRLFSVPLLCVALSVALAAEEGDPFGVDLAKKAAEAAETIKEVIGDDWTVTVNGQIVTIESKFDVFRIFKMSRPTPVPPLDAPTSELLKEAIPQKYVFRLRFEKPIEREEFIRRRSERQKHADVLNFGAPSRTAWIEAAAEYVKIQVPHYRQGFYDIYSEPFESPSQHVYPLAAISKIGAVKNVLDTLFRPMRTGSD